jgi:hypothetical protein
VQAQVRATADTHVTEAAAVDLSADGLDRLDSRLGVELMAVPEPSDREFVERTRKRIGLADIDARAVAAELLR